MADAAPEVIIRCEASRLWVGRNECSEMSVSGIVLVTLFLGWIILFITAGIRLIFLTNSAAKNTDVAKKMQFFQAWFYSLLYTTVSICSIFLITSLIMESQVVAALVMTVFFFLSLAFSSQVDVIGTVGKNQGVNEVDTKTMLQYLATIYLAKAVWKVSGHKERDTKEDEPSVTSGFRAMFCFEELENTHRPRVYDFKDVVGIQGAFLSLPTLLLLFMAYVKAYGVDSFQGEGEVESSEVSPSFKFDDFEILNLPLFLLMVSFVSALLTPLLGDWETLKKNAFLSLASLLFRAIELTGRVLFYAFFVDVSKYAAFLVLALEVAIMWFTTVNARDTSAAGRTQSISHKILASWEAVFFTRFRRVHVDKDFVLKNTSIMPYTIELIRFLFKACLTGIGYVIILTGVMPETYKLNNDYVQELPILLLVSAAANGLVFVGNMIFFLCLKRSKLSSQDIIKLTSYWMTLQPCALIFSPSVINVNRDNINYQANDEPVHYV